MQSKQELPLKTTAQEEEKFFTGSIPEELLLTMFSYCPPEVLQTLALVSTAFLRISTTGELWKRHFNTRFFSLTGKPTHPHHPILTNKTLSYYQRTQQYATEKLKFLSDPAKTLHVQLRRNWADEHASLALARQMRFEDFIHPINDVKKYSFFRLAASANLQSLLDAFFKIIQEHYALYDFLSREAYVDPRHGRTWQHFAVLCRQREALSNYDAFMYIDKADKNGITPLYLAAEEGLTTVTEALLAVAAKKINLSSMIMGSTLSYCVPRKNISEQTPLAVAISNNHTDIVAMMLKHSSSNDAYDVSQLVVMLHVAISAHADGSFQALWAILDGKIDINQKIKIADSNTTLLNTAASCGNVTAVRFLLDKGANIHHCINKLLSPVALAVQQGQHDVIEVFLEKCPDLDLQTYREPDGRSLLFLAIQGLQISMVKTLLEKYHVDPNAGFNNNLTPLAYASTGNRRYINDPRYQRILAIMELLLAHGANVNAATETDGVTVLFFAILNSEDGYEDAVKLLLKQPKIEPTRSLITDPTRLTLNFVDGDRYRIFATSKGATPLHIAAMTNNLTVSKLLLEKNPESIFITNDDGKTAIDVAVGTDIKDFLKTFEKEQKMKAAALLDSAKDMIADADVTSTPRLGSFS